MSDDGSVLFGPWPGSSRLPNDPAAATADLERRMSPNHPAGKHLPPRPRRQPNGALWRCTDCKRPFSPKGTIPADLVCRDCAGIRRAAADPTLFDGGADA